MTLEHPLIKFAKKTAATTLFFLLCSTTAHAEQTKSYGIALNKQKVCPVMQKHLGQLLYVSVDGFGRQVSDAIHPDYIKLVKLLDIGGVVPQFGRKDAVSIMASTEALFGAGQQPLLIGINSAKIDYKSTLGAKTVSVGLGAGSGWMKTYQAKNAQCFEQQTFLDAFLQKAMGLNQVLGPTIDRNKHWGGQFKNDEALQSVVVKILNAHQNMGIKTTLKHFPYSFESSNVNLMTTDAVMAKVGIFKHWAKDTDFVMTTHLFNPRIDSKHIATLSRNWIGLLKRDIGYQGLIIADALSRLKADAKALASFSKGWLSRHPADDPKVVFIAKAILAGHDMVFLQGVARDTLQTYEQLAKMACRDDPDGRLLQARITDSYGRITQFKNNNRGVLSYRPKIDMALINDALSYKDRLASNSCAATDDSQFEFLQLKQRILDVR